MYFFLQMKQWLPLTGFSKLSQLCLFRLCPRSNMLFLLHNIRLICWTLFKICISLYERCQLTGLFKITISFTLHFFWNVWYHLHTKAFFFLPSVFVDLKSHMLLLEDGRLCGFFLCVWSLIACVSQYFCSFNQEFHKITKFFKVFL